MKTLRFLDVSLMSVTERKARKITFNLGSNLILGLNHTGKSTLVKMLYETLGATPSGDLDGWDKAAISCVTLSVDDSEYKVLRQGDSRALFLADGSLVASAPRRAKWVSIFNALTTFNLELSDKQENTTAADPACFFLPFYINQDGSWGAGWNTFKRGLGRFKAPVQPILEFFSQIVPPAYYTAKAKKDGLQQQIAGLDAERTALARAKSRVSKALPAVGPKISAEAFEAEINRLTTEVNTLNERQEALRAIAIRENETLAVVRQEILAAERALADFGQDTSFLNRTDLNTLTCPTCGAEHSETFLSTLEYAEDARSLEATVLQLRSSENKLVERSRESAQEHNSLDASYAELERLLSVKRGEMKFAEVVESLGAESALGALRSEDESLEEATGTLLAETHELANVMKSYVDRKRKKATLELFKEHYNFSRNMLNLYSIDLDRPQLRTRPDLSGSGGPRAVLAYYAALWQVCSPTGQDTNVPPSIPLVIDCPNQQGQDAKNLRAIVSFLASRLPANAQTIITFETDVAEKFNQKIELNEPRGLLSEAEFEDVSAQLNPLIDGMRKDLLVTSA